MLGDFNAMFDNHIDRSQQSEGSKLPQIFRDFSEVFQLTEFGTKIIPVEKIIHFFLITITPFPGMI